MFGPLSFPSERENSPLIYADDIAKTVTCLLCEEKFVLQRQESVFLEHLLLDHNVIIRDVNKIPCFDRYIKYWKMKLKDNNLEEFDRQYFVKPSNITQLYHSAIQSSALISKVAQNVNIFVLSDDIPEDKELRNSLQSERLEFVLDQQRQEREMKNYCRECLFCHTDITGTTTDYLNHLSNKHNLFLGRPQNLVFVHQLIDTIEKKLVNLQCLYCEKVFKDRNVLKEHMRKKLHKRINPKNTEYDRFYVINYLEIGKTWKNIESTTRENETPETDNSDSDWSDWQEEMQLQIVCLFCKNNSVSWEDTLNHMKVEHGFDYKENTSSMDFYQQVKLVNYVRRQIHRSTCINCDFTSDDSIENLLKHMSFENHFNLPDKSLWDQPEYFFPTYENDLFLCQLDDPGKSDTNSISDELVESFERNAV